MIKDHLDQSRMNQVSTQKSRPIATLTSALVTYPHQPIILPIITPNNAPIVAPLTALNATPNVVPFLLDQLSL